MSLNFSHIQGDTFEAVSFQVVKNSVNVNLTGAVIKMQLKKNAVECLFYLLLQLQVQV